jgi:hypothetical protein
MLLYALEGTTLRPQALLIECLRGIFDELYTLRGSGYQKSLLRDADPMYMSEFVQYS